MNAPIVYLSCISMFFSLLTIFYNKGYQGANRFLAGTLFLFALYFLMQYVLIYSKSVSLVAFFSSGIASTYLLIGPLGYFYVRSIMKDSTAVSGWDYVHFVPFLVVFVGIMPFLFSSWDNKLAFAQTLMSNDWKKVQEFHANRLLNFNQNELLRLGQTIFYGIAWWVPIRKYRRQSLGYSAYQSRLIRRWLFLFCTISSILLLFRIWHGIAQIISSDRLTIMSLISGTNFFAVLFFLALNVLLFLFPQILYGLPAYTVSDRLVESDSYAQEDLDKTVDSEEQEAGYSQFFSADYLKEIEERLGRWVSEKEFLNTETTMPQLALQVGIPIHHLRYYFNQNSTEKFTDWRNQLKVDYAKQLIQEGFTRVNTLEALVDQVGFSSRSTFFRVFKKAEGMTPSEYDQLCREK